MKKYGLLPRIVIAIVMGILIGNVLPEGWVRVFVTFIYVFGDGTLAVIIDKLYQRSIPYKIG